MSLLTRADLCLARSTPELAWPLVERATAITGDRARTLLDFGQYERLRSHFLWVSQGYDAVRALGRPESGERYWRLMDRLEVQAFEEWVCLLEGVDAPSASTSTLSRIESSGMFGVLARLVSLGVRLPGVPEPMPGESSAQLVARLFPHHDHHPVPPSVGRPARGAE